MTVLSTIQSRKHTTECGKRLDIRSYREKTRPQNWLAWSIVLRGSAKYCRLREEMTEKPV